MQLPDSWESARGVIEYRLNQTDEHVKEISTGEADCAREQAKLATELAILKTKIAGWAAMIGFGASVLALFLKEVIARALAN